MMMTGVRYQRFSEGRSNQTKTGHLGPVFAALDVPNL
jgi:hypothetical protein